MRGVAIIDREILPILTHTRKRNLADRDRLNGLSFYYTNVVLYSTNNTKIPGFYAYESDLLQKTWIVEISVG